MVFQRFNLFPHLTALENIIEAPIRVGVKQKDAVERADELLDQVGLGAEGAKHIPRSSPAASSSGSRSPGRSL